MNTNDLTKHVGWKIRQLRQKQGWTQGKAASQLGISIPAFSKIETGITDCNLSRITQIATLFETEIEDLVTKEERSGTTELKQQIATLKKSNSEKDKEIAALQVKLIKLYEEQGLGKK